MFSSAASGSWYQELCLGIQMHRIMVAYFIMYAGHTAPQPSSEDSKGDNAYSPSTGILINPTVLLSPSQKCEKFCRKPEAAFSVLEVSCQQCYWQE